MAMVFGKAHLETHILASGSIVNLRVTEYTLRKMVINMKVNGIRTSDMEMGVIFFTMEINL